MKELKMFFEILTSKKVSETIILDLQLFLAELRQKVADELLKPLAKNEYFKEKEFESAIKLVDELVEKMLTIENIKKEHISIAKSAQQGEEMFSLIDALWDKKGLATLKYNKENNILTFRLL